MGGGLVKARDVFVTTGRACRPDPRLLDPVPSLVVVVERPRLLLLLTQRLFLLLAVQRLILLLFKLCGNLTEGKRRFTLFARILRGLV